jgi:hypothetical protein
MDIPNNTYTNDLYNNIEWQDEVDMQFIQRVVNEVTQSCILPNPVPLERIPDIILQVCQWFWSEDDGSVEQRFYFIKNSDICKQNAFNKIITLPQQIMGVQGCYKTSNIKYGALGDFSIERMMMSSYSMFGGVGSITGGFGSGGGMTGYNLTDVTMSLYEIDTFQQTLNPTLSYNYNMYSKKLVILGDLRYSDLVIDCWKRIPIQALYSNYYFFRACVCYVKRALSSIYGSIQFKLPGGVEINYDLYQSQADEELDKIQEWIDNNRAVDYFFQPNII